MAKTNKEVAKAFALRLKASGNNVYCDGKTIYSYGEHFPMARWIDLNTIVFNKDTYSNSTSKHQGVLLSALSYAWKYPNIIYVDTNTIKKCCNNSGSVNLCDEEKTFSFDELMVEIKKTFKDKGMKRFPNKKIKDFLEQILVLDAI